MILPKRENKKEIFFMQLVVNLIKQFQECDDSEALEFVCTLLDKMKEQKLRIK
jgi:hypothetical protein